MIFESKTFNLNFKNAVGYLTFKGLEKLDFIKHGFSTRLGGVSRDEYFSMNLGFNRGDDRKNVIENYHLFCEAIGVEYESLVASSQDHHTYIRPVTDREKGIGITRPHDMSSVDGLMTNIPGVTLVTYYADCVPLFFIDPDLKVIGLAHAGWRGSVGQIGRKMINEMHEIYGCEAEGIIVGIGPSIGPCCYEVDEPVADEFAKMSDINPEYFITEKSSNGKYHINLWEANRQALLKAGIPSENIQVSDLCTSCASDLLISHRKTDGNRETMAAVLQLIQKFQPKRRQPTTLTISQRDGLPPD